MWSSASASDSSYLDDNRSQQSPHMYLSSPREGDSSIILNKSSAIESDRELLEKKEWELTHLRHKLQCADNEKHDLMEEYKSLQEENGSLVRKVEHLEKTLRKKDQQLKSPSARKSAGFSFSLTNSPQMETDSKDIYTKYEELLEETRKNKINMTELEDKIYLLTTENQEVAKFI